MKRPFLFAAALAVSLAASSAAHAGGLNFVCRHLGLGWSDGYHAQCDCGPACGSKCGDKGFAPKKVCLPRPCPVAPMTQKHAKQ